MDPYGDPLKAYPAELEWEKTASHCASVRGASAASSERDARVHWKRPLLRMPSRRG